MVRPTAYAAHEHLVGPARHRAQLWRLLVGLSVVVFVVFGLNIVMRALMQGVAPQFWQEFFPANGALGTSPLSMLILLASFGFTAIGAGVAVRVIHQRRARDLIGPWPLARIQFGAVLWMLLALSVVVLVLPPWNMGLDLQPNLALTTWVLLLPLSLAAVLIQTGAEEILFRGYLQQQLAARFSSPWAWMVLPSLLFGAAHYDPVNAGDNALLIVAWSGLFGLLMADLTARAGTLGPAIAVHLVNNLSALIFISMPDMLSGLSLFTVPYGLSDTSELRAWLPVDFALAIVSWLAARLAIGR